MKKGKIKHLFGKNTTSLFVAVYAGLAYAGNLAAQPQKPNIVLIITDQQRADLCGREGFPLPVTPYADSLAGRYAWFDKAYTAAPASAPARCSLLTGRFPSATHVRTNHNIPDAYYEKDLVDVLKEKGYRTALVGKNHTYLNADTVFDYFEGYGHRGKDRPQTDDEKALARFLTKQVPGHYLRPAPFGMRQQQPYQIVSKALHWAQQQKQAPFFLCVSIPEPHTPSQVCDPYFSMFPPEILPPLLTSEKEVKKKGDTYEWLALLEEKACPHLQRDLPRLRSIYLGMIRMIDDQIKRLVEGIRSGERGEQTLFIILSDHGDYAGEYGLIRKGAGVAESLVRIPMIWAGYGIQPQNRPMPAHVSIVDLFPTLCSVVGAEIPPGVQGRSLWPMLRGEAYPQEEFSSIVVEQGYGGENFTRHDSLTFEQAGSYKPDLEGSFDGLNPWTQSGSLRMVRKGGWKLVMDARGRGELYNLATDPSEIQNLFGDPQQVSRQADLLKELLTWTIRLQDPLPVPRKQYPFKKNPYNYSKNNQHE